MKRTLIFNQDTSKYALEDQEYNLLFILMNQRYLNDLLMYRNKRISLEYAYEELGIEWDLGDDEKEKHYWINNGGVPVIDFNVRPCDDGIELTFDI